MTFCAAAGVAAAQSGSPGFVCDVIGPGSSPRLADRQRKTAVAEAGEIGAKAKVLVVEDDENILNLLSVYLESAGYEVVARQDGREAFDDALNCAFDICILDVMLPNRSGVEIAEAMRQSGSTTPVLFLTALGAEADVLGGFAAGADDYVVKPFSPRELLVRIDAILRRSRGAAPNQNEVLEVGPLRLDADQPTCSMAGTLIALTPYEHKILRRLLEQPNRVLARGQLVAILYGNDSAVGPKAIDVHVHNLRSKLGAEAGSMIETVRGFGYRFSPAPEAARMRQ